MTSAAGRQHLLVGRSGWVLRLLGLWTPPAQHDRAGDHAALPLLRCGLSFFLMSSMPVVVFSKLYMDTPYDLEELSTCIFVIMASIALLIKTGCFVWQQGSVYRLLRMVAAVRAEHSERAAPGGGSSSTRAQYRRQADAIFLYMQGMTAVALVGWVCAPLASRLFSSDDDGDESPAPLKTPLPTWTPAAAQRSPAYESLYLFETLCLTVASQALLCVDVFFIDLILLVAAELHVLNDNLTAVSVDATGSESREDTAAGSSVVSTQHRRSRAFSDTFAVLDAMADQMMSEEMYRQLVGNIRHHQMVIECVEVLQMTMTYSIFALLFFNMTSICLNIFVTASLLQSDADLITALKAVFTTPVFLYESAMYCIFGQMIIDQSEQLLVSAFNSGWPDADTRLQRSLLVFMLRSSQPLKIQVGKTYELSKDTFVRVLNGSYALFNMLYTFQGNK